MIRQILLLFLLLMQNLLVVGQKSDKSDQWDVSRPAGPYQEVSITTSEGTWMNLDVSPDGQTIAFDLLGDIYSVPINGGTAKPLRTGLAWEVQPRFSPDGQRILFTSDSGGGDNIWVMDANGENARQITKESFRLLNNGVWVPDSDFIIARKHFTSQRSLGAGEMWMYHISGGSGVQLTKRKNDQQDVNEPAVSPDGRYLYFSEDLYPGGYFQYNKDPNDQIYAIRRYDRQTGKLETFIGGPGGAARPQVSNDGRKLAYVRRVRTKSVLFIHDIETGQDFPLFDGLSKDQQEAWAIFGVYTGFDWTPDDNHIIIWGKGKIWRVNVLTKKATEIPFTATATHRLANTLRFEQKIFEDQFNVRTIRQARTSPDGQMIVFNAIGNLWKKQLPNGRPERLTGDNDLEFEPSFSPSGNELVYVSWNDENLGAIWKLNLTTGQKIKLSSAPGIYRTPSFSPDGRWIVYRKTGGNNHQGYLHSREPGIYYMPAGGGAPQLVTVQGANPLFSADGKRIFYQTGGGLAKAFRSIEPDGSDKKVIFNTKYTNRFVPSPDNRWVAFTELWKVYIAPMPRTGQPIGLTADTKAVPVAQVARDAGINLHWSADSRKLHWDPGRGLFYRSAHRKVYFPGRSP